MDERLVVAWHLTWFSKLYEGPSMRAIYLAKRVTTQLIGERDMVPIALTPFILFPFSFASEDLATWRAGIPFESRVDTETSFEDSRRPSCFLFRHLFR